MKRYSRNLREPTERDKQNGNMNQNAKFLGLLEVPTATYILEKHGYKVLQRNTA